MGTRKGYDEKGILTPPERLGQLVIVGMMVLLTGFFVYHQYTHTGFFTDKFGTWEMLALYGPILLGMAAPLSRGLNGHRNPARPLEALGSLALALGSLWLLVVFPFDYAHLADPLPQVSRFVMSWITDNIGRLLLILQIIIGPIAALLQMWKFITYHPAGPVGGQRGFSPR